MTNAFFKKDFALARKEGFVTETFGIFSQTLELAVFFFLLQSLGSVLPNHSEHFKYLFVGLLTFRFVNGMLASVEGTIRQDKQYGILEKISEKPKSIRDYLLSSFHWPILHSWIRLVIVGVSVSCLFRNPLPPAQSLLGLILLLGTACLLYLSLGITAGALYLLFQRGGLVLRFFQAAHWIFGSVYFPPEILPSSLQWVSALLPLPYLLNGIRSLTGSLGSPAPRTFIPAFLPLPFLLFLVLIPLSFLSFFYAIRKTKQWGTLGPY